MTEPLPTNPDILRWARETARLSTEDVAHKLGRRTVTADTIAAWEQGIGAPNFPQLETLALTIYKRPLAVFFFPIVPEEDTPKTELRTLPDTVIDDFPAGMVRFYRKAKLFQLYLAELYEGERPVATPLLDRPELSQPADWRAMAGAVRAFLGISMADQARWRSAAIAVKQWREVLESSGIFVFKDAFRNDGYSGLCLYSDRYPIIYVNNSMPATRQAFTLFHEVAHLLQHAGGVDFNSEAELHSFQGYYRRLEIWCNRFAKEVLVPQDVLASFPLAVSETQFQNLADYFSVSREAILRSYLDQGLVDTAYYEHMAARWAEQARNRPGEESQGSYYNNTRAYLGDRYINLVYSQYHRKRITVENVAEYLHINLKNLPAFEQLVLGGRS